jgi:hypothetical protein
LCPKRVEASASDAELEFRALLRLLELEPSNRAYSEALKTPISRVSELELILRGSPDQQESLRCEEDKRLVSEQFGKLFLLLDHFEIPRNSRLRWFHLAFQLARQYVPGMQIQKGPARSKGPKPKYEGVTSDLALLESVILVKRERKLGAEDAIRILRQRDPEGWGKFTQKALRNRYYEIVRRPLPSPDGDLIDNLKVILGLSATIEKSDNSKG